MALITAMLVCMFLFMLTGALIQTQSGVFAVAQSSDARARSRAACQSLYDYCLYQLEHDREWGREGFAGLAAVDPMREVTGSETVLGLESRVEVSQVSGRVFRGYLPEHQAGFEVEVINALTTPGGVSSGDITTPHEQVRLKIAAWEGRDPQKGSRSRQEAECTLRLAPLFDSSILSRGDISVNAKEVLFASKDPFRNEIRAEGNVTLPQLTQGKTRFVEHNQEVIRENSDLNNMTPDPTGMLWAGKDIAQFNAYHEPEAISDASLATAAQRSGGRMVPDATNRADIYDLKPENIPQPNFTQDKDIRTPPGEFRFTKALATIRYEEVDPDDPDVWVQKEKQAPVNVLEYYDPPDSPEPLKVMRRDPSFEDTPTQKFKGMDIDYGPGRSNDVPVVVGDRFYMDFDKFQDSVDVKDINGNTIQVPEMGFRRAVNGGSGPVAIDLATQTVVVQSQTRVRPAARPEGSILPPSAFQLTVKEGQGGMPDPPTFALGSGTNDVVIEADGDIAVGAGYTKGLGTFISKRGSVTLNPKAQELKWVQKYFDGIPYWVLENEVEIEANANYAGLVIYAQKDVNIANISDADWAVRGFVYARGNFNFDIRGHNATFFGSVVAGNNPADPGRFHIVGGKRATFIYDPEYLKLLTRQLPHNWTRVEALLWSEANG